jgi:hypothetical protein
MTPPFEVKPFEKMTLREAQNHFDWYVDEIPKRIELIRRAYKDTGGGKLEDLDLTPQSLVNLWTWFIPRIQTMPRSTEDIAEELRTTPEWLKETVIENNKKLSTGALCLAMDIAIYFGATFVKNFDRLSWGFVTKPKSLAYVNKPVIIGFSTGVELDPIGIVYNLTLDVVNNNTNIKELFELYDVWSAEI